MKKILLVVLAMLFTAAAVVAQTTWIADKAHSKVSFSVSHMVIAEVAGRFQDFDATLISSKDDFSDAQIDVRIKTGSIDTDNERRDKHLASDDFLNAEKYPEITFKSTKIEKAGKDTYKITGDLTIREITKPVVLDTKYNGQVTVGENTKAGFRATTTIDRFEFGTKWNKEIESVGLVAGKDVYITLLLEFNKQTADAKGK